MTSEPLPHEDHSQPEPLWRALVEIALVFAVFSLHGAWPMPDDNETGYVIKAQHYWNPDSFKTDFFANTADAHLVYYWSFGWLTTLGWSLTTVAWIGRITTWLMLAISWRGLSWALIRRPWIAVLSAELFLLLCERGQMAGEWVAGSVEAKGFAWAFVLWALTALVYGRWNLAWLLAGIATSLHVVVGGWSAVCLATVWLGSRGNRPAMIKITPGVVAYILLAIPGLYPALAMNRGVDWQTVAEANRIQVFERLRHHLLPFSFSKGGITRQVLLWVLFLSLCRAVPATDKNSRLRRFVAVAIGLSLIGFVLSAIAIFAPTFAASLLRFYWTRMSDIVVPIGVVLTGIPYALSLRGRATKRRHWLWSVLLIVATIDAAIQVRHLPWWPESFGALPARTDRFDDLDSWIDACNWVADSGTIPTNAVFLTPCSSRSFKWFTHRGEVVTWKDMPQDAKSIVEWWKRLNEIDGTGNDDPDLRWRDSIAELGDHKVDELADKYGAQYAIVELLPDVPRLTRQPLYENKSFAVYRVGSEKR